MYSKDLSKTRVTGKRIVAQLVDVALIGTMLIYVEVGAGHLIEGDQFVVVFLAMLVGYFTILEGFFGRTPGKLLMSVKVVRDGTSDPPALKKALVRTVLRVADTPLGWFVMMHSGKRQRLGDIAAGTVVVDAPGRHPGATNRRARPKHVISGKQAEELRVKEARLEAGQEGERVVREELSDLCLEGRYYLFNDLYEPAVGNIDHLVIGACGLVLVETKANWGALTLSDDAPVLINDAELPRDPLTQMSNQMAALDQRLDYETSFHPGRTVNEFLGYEGHHWVLCFSRAWIEGPVGIRRARQVVTRKYLVPHIRSYETIFDDATIDYLVRQVRNSYGQLPEPQPGPESTGNHDGSSGSNTPGRLGRTQRRRRQR